MDRAPGTLAETDRRATDQADLDLAVSFDNAPIGISLTDIEGNYLRVNPALCNMLGYSAQQLLTMNWRDVTHPADIATNEAASAELGHSKPRQVGAVEKRYIRSDGSMVWVLLSVVLIRDDAGDPVYSLAHIQDVTRHRATEAALSAAETRFRTVFENAPIGMVLLSPVGTVLRANAAVCRTLGYTADELSNMLISDFMHAGDRSALAERIGATGGGGEDTFRLECRCIAANGDAVPVGFSASVVRDADGEPDYLIGHLVDLSELQRANSQLHKLLDERENLIASVSHELRTPITGVMGFAELLSDPDSGIPTMDRASMITTIADQSRDLANIVDDLLTATRIESDTLAVAKVPVDLKAQAAQVVEGLDTALQARVTMRTELARGVGDPARVRQILRNLLVNASRYGGEHIEILTATKATTVEIDVVDDGNGVPPTDEDRIFAPYQRADTSSPPAASVGLGLAISRRLARLMGGDLVYLRDDGHTVFRFSLSRNDAEPEGPGTGH